MSDTLFPARISSAMGSIMGISGGAVGYIFTQTADKTVTNTTSETTILGTGAGSLTLPANFWTVGKVVRVTLAGIYSTPAIVSSSITVKVKLGSTVVSQVTSTALLTNASSLQFGGSAIVVCRSTGVSGSVIVSGELKYSTGIVGTIAFDPLNNSGAATTFDTTGSAALDVTVTWDAATTTRIAKSTIAMVEVLS